MSGTPNPSSNIAFGNGNSGLLPDLADNVILLIGPASAGPVNKPRRTSTLSAVLAFQHGPLVGQASHHVTYSQACYVQRCNASTPGAAGGVTKAPAASSLGTVAVSNTAIIPHAQFVNNGAAMNLTSGFVTPPSPLPLQLTVGAAPANPLNITVRYYDEQGLVKSETINFTATGTKSTTGTPAAILSIASDVDPLTTVDFLMQYAGPQDRYDVVWEFLSGGQLSGGFAQPTGRWSADGGKTWGRTQQVPSSGVVDLYSYAGGLTPQASGIRLTFSSAAATGVELGSIRAPGADVNGDTVWTSLKAGSSLTIAVSGNNTPLSISLVGDAVTIHSATDSGGAVSTTANALLSFFNTDSSPSTASARQRFRAHGVGTGLSMIAALSVKTTANADITWTAKQEDVAYRVIEAGVSQAAKVLVTATDVDIYLATDANGVRTSTAAQIVALVAASSTASKLLSGVAGGTGADLAGDTSGYQSLPVQFSTEDQFIFSTTPPTATNADMYEALLALEKRDDVMGNISGIGFVKDGADSLDFATFHGELDNMGAKKKQFLFGLISAPYMGTTPEDQWVTNTTALYTARGTKVSVVAGEVDTLIPAYGTESRRNFSTLYTARLMNCPISELPSHTECDCGDNLGLQYSLPGVGSHLIPGGDPNFPEFTSMYQSDDALVQLHSQNMVTPRMWARLTGVYVRQGVQFVTDGDDYTFITARRIADVAATLAYLETVRMVNASLLTDPTTGQLAEAEHLNIEDNVTKFVGAKLLDDNGRKHIVALKVTSDRNIDYSSTDQVSLSLNLVTKKPAITFSTTINVVKTIDPSAGSQTVG